jgi:hypothetical protein
VSAPRMSPAARYLVRFSVGMALYVVGLLAATALWSHHVPGPVALLLTLPGIAVIVWAVIAHFRGSDEFEQRKMGESFTFAFALGVPVVLALGLWESFGGPHLNAIVDFMILMAAWLVGAIVSNLRYR